jgi:hypothetical protein
MTSVSCKEKYLDNVKENNGGRIKYLSVEEQSYLYPLLSESLSLNSFGTDHTSGKYRPGTSLGCRKSRNGERL